MVKKSYNLFERLQKITLIFTLSVTGLVILFLLWQIHLPGNIKIIVEIIAAIILFLFSLFIIVINEIPRSLPHKFDAIKNKIASREIRSTEEFSAALNTFLVNYFHFITFDIMYAAVQVKDEEIRFSNEKLKSISEFLHPFHMQSKQQNSPIKLGKVLIDNNPYSGYVIPMYFGGEWLGYFAVFTTTKLNAIYLDFLDRFEDDYIDDQLVHVLFNATIRH